jgi:succinate-semialdehyde dehydrogenase/glutarate-semialdehyde dehydrogenase
MTNLAEAPETGPLPSGEHAHFGETIPVGNPATGEIIGHIPNMGAEQIAEAMARARRAQKTWGALSPTQRAARLKPFQQVLLDNWEELSEIIMKETGKATAEAQLETLDIVLTIDGYCKRAPKVLGRRSLPMPLLKHKRSYTHFKPRGVVGIIAPWNYPLLLAGVEMTFALLAGNAVLIKPSEATPLAALRMHELWVEHGFDPDLLQIVTGDGNTGRELIDGGIDYLCFTGSVPTGRKVGAHCGRLLLPCTLELGNKSAAIVCEDADLERTANALVWGAFMTHGQVCASVERVYVRRSIFERLKEKLIEKTNKLRQGDPATGVVDVGACCFPPQAEHVHNLLKDAEEKGAVFETGEVNSPDTRFIKPTILTGLSDDMEVLHHESFGPVMPLIPVDSDEEALEKVNAHPSGLIGYVFTEDKPRGRQLAEDMQVGTVMINDVVVSVGIPETPWSGLKQSGVGTAHSDDFLIALSETRHVWEERFRMGRKELWWYPYTQKKIDAIARLVRSHYSVRWGEKMKNLLGGQG